MAMFISIVLLMYVLPVILSYKVTRNWHLSKGIKPSGEDVLFVILPIVNIATLFVYVESNIAEKFFRINSENKSD